MKEIKTLNENQTLVEFIELNQTEFRNKYIEIKDLNELSKYNFLNHGYFNNRIYDTYINDDRYVIMIGYNNHQYTVRYLLKNDKIVYNGSLVTGDDTIIIEPHQPKLRK